MRLLRLNSVAAYRACQARRGCDHDQWHRSQQAPDPPSTSGRLLAPEGQYMSAALSLTLFSSPPPIPFAATSASHSSASFSRSYVTIRLFLHYTSALLRDDTQLSECTWVHGVRTSAAAGSARTRRRVTANRSLPTITIAPLSCGAVMEGSAFFFERAAYDGVPGETLAGMLPPIHSYYGWGCCTLILTRAA